MKILYTTTTPIAALAFFAPQLAHLRRQGHDVHLVTPPEPADLVTRAQQIGGATYHPLSMAREIVPRRDLGSLAGMLQILRRVRPDIVNFSTPKAGLLGGVASVLSGVPLRVYFIHGLRSETAATGALARLRPLLRAVERLTCACAHEVLCVSESNREEAVALGLVAAHKIRVLGAGSPAGLNVQCYAQPDAAAVAQARADLALPAGTPVVGFVGRLAPQKGTEELLLAWAQVRQAHPHARLLLVGTPDPANPLSDRAARAYHEAQGVVQVDFEADMSRLYPLMTVFTLPSRHEGLGMVVLEAAAAGVPSVLTDAPGVRDAGVPGQTSVQVPTGDVSALAGALITLLADPEQVQRLGNQAQNWVHQHFEQAHLWALWDDFYASAWSKRQQHKGNDWGKCGVALLVAGLALAVWAGKRR
ncbi:glycosyltransferase family 4 protein [Deinococcus frigens]|uniref:glycosyltransferase family 4 protein n=1 Tax=Deinococcus frigens TaxID=249403 RepID=UPI0004973C27|nr:glycosyltransferase family 4 protein [Deinococcus frigens]